MSAEAGSAGRDPTQRFSSRVEDYVRYRPSYPEALIDLLVDAVGLRTSDVVADVGSGTGKLTELFLRHGNRVLAVEPNRAMREAAERRLGDRDGFVSVEGTAEATALDDRCARLVVAGQAFHWFERAAARAEFERILEPDGAVVLVWNDRRHETDGFMADYEALLAAHGTDYRRVNHQKLSATEIAGFFAPAKCRIDELPNRQRLDRTGLLGRLCSSSYLPGAGDPGHAALVEAAGKLFERHARDGHVSLEYVTRVYSGRLSGGGSRR